MRFFLKQKRRCVVCIFLEQKKRVKPCVVRSSFSAVLLQQKKKKRTADNPSFFSVEERQPDNLFFGYIFSERFSYSDQIQRTVFG